MERLRAVTVHPDQCRSWQLITRHIILPMWFNYALNKPGLSQALQQVCDNLVRIFKAELLTISCKGCSTPEILSKTTTSRKIHVTPVIVGLTWPRKENPGMFFCFIFI